MTREKLIKAAENLATWQEKDENYFELSHDLARELFSYVVESPDYVDTDESDTWTVEAVKAVAPVARRMAEKEKSALRPFLLELAEACENVALKDLIGY